MGYFRFRNKNIYYYEVGADHLPPLVFLHGNMSNHKRWLPLLEYLKKDFKCYALDFPGSGLSEDVDEYHSLKMLANCVSAFADLNKITDYVLFGHSMGGGVAQLVAVRNTNKIKKLVLVNSISCNGFHEFYNQRDYISSMYRNKEQLFEIFKESFPNLSQHPVLYEMVDDAYKASERVFTDEPKAMSEFNIQNDVGAVKIPVLIIYSSGDKIVSEADILDMRSKYDNCTYEVLEDYGHSPHYEAPGIVNDVFLHFMKREG